MTDGLRFQSGLGTNFTRRYKEGQQINTLLLAQVINVNYKYNTVDLMSLQHKEVFQNSYANEGKFSAKLPIEFGGRNIAGQPYGQINPIAVGNIVLVGFINADKNMPIVLSVYNDGTVSNKLTQAPFANADPTDEELQRHTYQKFQVYPSLTYDGIDGEGTRVASFSGKSFFLVSASEERDSGTTDAGYGTNYEDLATSYYNDGELIEPMVPMAPTILFNHQGIEDEDGNEDTHKLLFHIERDGTYRTSMLDKTADWRTFFEMKPDGGVRLRRQGDSIRIDDGFEVGEIGISSDGRVYLRNGDTDLEVRADGLYSNGAPLSVDLSSIYEKLQQQDDKLVSMSTSIIKTDEKVQILADKTEYYDDKIVDYDASFTVMAEMIESKVTATEVQDMIDGAVTDFTGEIAKVQADADRANQVISDMASDNRVTPSEKNQLLTEWDLIQNEYPTYIAQAEVYEVSTASYTAKYNAVKAFVEPILADMTATSVVDGTLMRKTFGAYYTERTALLTAILKDLKDGLVEAMQKASQASIDAGEAKADATQATIDANRANSLIADIASDGKLTASEKSQLKKEWNIVLKEYPTTLAQANKYEISTADYTAKYTALQTFVTPLLADMSATSVVDGDQLRAVFANYYDVRVKLLRSISDSAKDDLLDYGQRIYVAETKITQTSESITLLATKVQSIEDDVLTNTAELKVQAELISQKVTASEVKNVVDSAINDMTIGTANLYVIYTQTAGLLSETDGTVKTAVDDSVVSDYIKVKPSSPYVASVFDNTGSNTIIVAWYDTNKAFISGQAVAGSNEFSQAYKSPSNAVYARVSYKKSKTVKMKFESGTKGSDFSYSWADVKNDQTLLEQYVKDVQEEAQQAQADAENAKNQAGNANQAINDMSNDNVLTPLEKQQVLLQWEEIQAEYSKNIDQASKFNVSSTLYASAYSALSTYLTPILADLTSKSIIIGSTMRANFKTYYDRRTTLLNAVAEKAKTLADNAQTVADKADSDLNNIGGYNYVGFSSGDNMLPRLMIDNVGNYLASGATTAFEGDKVALTPNTVGGSAVWYYDIGTSSASIPKNGLSSYRLGDIEVGKWLTFTVNMQVFGTGGAVATIFRNDGSWISNSSEVVTSAQGLRRVTAQIQTTANTKAVLLRITPISTDYSKVTKILFSKAQLEVGIRPTPWKKSDIDVQEDINNVAKELEGSIGNAVSIAEQAQADADKAQETADNAVTSASKANSAIEDIASDNKVTAVEKKSLKKEWDIIVSEKPTILEQATKFGVTSTDYSTKYTALATFITPILADLSTTSVVVGTTLRSTFKAYYDEKTKLLNAVAVKAKELADKAQVDATNAKNTASQAVADAERAQTTADKSAEDATKANQAINDMSNDNLVTPAEKLDLKKEWEVILAEKPINDAQAVKFGVAYADYTAKYNALSTYITPILTSLTTNSAIVGQTMRDTFKAYYTARTALLNSISVKAKELADKAQTDADNAGIKADNAQTSANKAQTSADKAQTDANKAQELANNAQVTADKAQSDATSAQTSATKAQTDANKANQSIADLSNDNLVTPNEKLDLKKEWEIIVAEKVINDAQADKFGVSKADYTSKYTALSNYITPILTSLTTNSAIVGQTMRDTFKAYYTARTALLNSISVKAKELADKAQTDANKAQADADNAQSSADTAQNTADNAQTSANKAQSDANTAQSNANKAQSDANKANQSISDLSNDNLVTPSEKLDLKKEWEIIVAEKVINDAQADKFGVSKTDYGTKYTALSNYITPILTSLTTNSVVVGQTMRDIFKAYYTARTALLNTVATKAKELADRAQSTVDGLEIGGRNLVRNTGFVNGKHPFTGAFGNPFRGLETIDGVKAYKIQHSNVDSTQQGVFVMKSNLTVAPAIGDTFTFSVVVKGSGLFSNMRMENADNSRTWGGSEIPSEWTKITITGKHTGTGGAFVFYIRQNATLYIKENSLKLESGNQATAWTPAPEDAQLYTAWSNDPNGKDMVRVYPNENLLVRKGEFTEKIIGSGGGIDPYAGNNTSAVPIPVTAGETLYFSQSQAPTATVCFRWRWLNADMKYISRAADASNQKFTGTVPSGASYLQVSYSASWDSKIERNGYTTMTPSPVDNPVKAEMAYIGYSPKDSNDPSDYVWSENPKAKGTFKRWANDPNGLVDMTDTYPNENLLLGTSNEVRSASGTGWFDGTRATNATQTPPELEFSTNYTYSAYLTAPSDVGVHIYVRLSRPGAPNGSWEDKSSNIIPAGKSGLAKVTFSIPTDTTTISFRVLRFASVQTSTKTIQWSREKLELGSNVTTWTSNPQEDKLLAVPQYVGIGSKDTMNPADFVWTQNTDYMTAVTEQALNGKEGSWIYSPTEPSNPAVGVMWVDSSVVPNQPKRWTGAQTGWVALTPEEASDIPWGEDGSSLADWVAQAEQRISADSIINTVLGSEDFTGIFDTKADTEDLTNLASYDDLASMQEEYQRLLQEGIDGIDFSPYVKNSELEQLKDSFNFTIQQAGGVNMLRNSLGFSGEDFWNGGTSGNLLLNTGTMTSRIVGASTVDTANSYNGNTTIKATWSSGTVDPYRQKTANTPRDGQYTITFWAKADRTITFNNYFYSTGTTTSSVNSDGKTGTSSDGLSQLTATTAWKRYWITWDSKSATTVKEVLLGRLFGTGTIWINSPMLVEGTTPVDWAPAPTDAGATSLSAFETTQNDDLANLGFGSGFLLDHKAGGALKQSVTLPEAKAGLYYAVSFYMNIASTSTGVTAGIKVYEDGKQSYIVGHTDASKVSPNGYQRYYLIYEPSSVNTEIEIFVTGASNTTVVISGIMFNIGNVALKWQPYPSEIYNTNVKIDINGITVKNNQTDGYTMITPQEFSGYARVDGEMERIFTLNGETTEVRMLKAEQRITMLPIAIFAMENSVNRGWAFVSSSAT